MTDQSAICTDCGNLLWDLLDQVTAHVIRTDREPRTETIKIKRLDGTLTEHTVIVRGDFGRQPSTRWDTPSGEVSNLPRMLDEQTARLAVRSTQARLTVKNPDPPMPIDVHSSRDADTLRSAVWDLAADVAGYTPPRDAPFDLAAVASWLQDKVTVIRRHDWAPRHIRAIEHAIQRAVRCVDATTRRITVACQCGTRVPVCDGGEMMTCRACGESGVLDWWIKQAPAAEGPMTLTQIRDWLIVTHNRDVPIETLRTWSKRQRSSNPEDGTMLPSVGRDEKGRKLFEPVVAADLVVRRVTRTAG